MIYEGEGVRCQNNIFSGYNSKRLIGWVDDDNKGTYTFTGYDENTDKVSGLNYFGSVYIGDNNPVNPGDSSNFDLPAQDAIDQAAKEHDMCYVKTGCSGSKDALTKIDCVECDDELSVTCFSTVISNYNKNMLNNPKKFVETLNLAGFSVETLYSALNRILDRDVNFFLVRQQTKKKHCLRVLLLQALQMY